MDALNKADLAQTLVLGEPADRVFDVQLAGLDGHSVSCRHGVSLHPATTAADVVAPDLVVVPGLDDDLAASFDENRGWVPWLRTWHAAGSRIAGSCTGAFLVADAGLLEGRSATTHWMYADELSRRYPSVKVTSDRMIVDTGDVITSGGATAFLNLVLYLVERFAGHERANLAAKVLLVDGHRPSQRPYIAFGRERSHGDTIVHQVQEHIDLHLDDPLRVAELASRFGLSERTLSRRFAAATGRGPHAYLQHARLQHAMRLLEVATEPIDQIRRSVGYHDAAAFRRVFKEATGLCQAATETPTDFATAPPTDAASCALASPLAVGHGNRPTSLRPMALRPDEFYDHALSAADSEGRLPLARMTGWDISPFELDGLRVAPLRPPVLPEPAREGEDPSDCNSCRRRDQGIWLNDRWRLTRMAGVGVPLVLMLLPRDHYDMADLPDDVAAELGRLSAHIVRHIEALPHISRAHVYRIGDGGAHLHVWFFARPEGQAQLYGSWMVVWDDLLPEYPADVAEADAATVADSLVASYGGRRPGTSEASDA